MKKLNLGCGGIRPEGWINTDSSLNAHLQRLPVIGKPLAKMLHKVSYDTNNLRYMNLNKRWKFADNSVDIVYSSHTFEHLSLTTTELFLKESFRVLKPGGVLRLVVPDLYKICKKYVTELEAGKEDASEYTMWAINMHREGQYGPKISAMKKMVYEWQGYPHQHKFMYDEKSLANRFRQHGFVDILSLSYGQSRYIKEIAEVEGKSELYLSVYLEARKPS